jgi:hypothetical protein
MKWAWSRRAVSGSIEPSVLARDGVPRARLIAAGNLALNAWPR